ncbi:MAG: hypothetical protein CMH54_01240 [Myxococcales bacterium]|nr:hypothetical protein [Myxococcales bacterium]
MHNQRSKISLLTVVAATLLMLVCMLPNAEAKPTGPGIFCQTYPEMPVCQGNLVACSPCHDSTWPTSWNAYGLDVWVALNGEPYEQGLATALQTIEDIDSDQDGLTNLQELLSNTMPGEAQSVWIDPPTPIGLSNSWYEVGSFDYRFAFRRVGAIFCGQSPTYEELIAFEEGVDPGTEEGQALLDERLHDYMGYCLDTVYWRRTALWSMADKRIRPLTAAGVNSSIGLVLADYYWDYYLFEYVLTGDRDARHLLTADYHVQEDLNGDLEVVTGSFAGEAGIAPGQPLQVERRAGMITTQWFLVINTMFSPLPRTSAAHALRSYLGMDIARSEGLLPVENEPIDIDNKGVAEAPCSHCHSTLDPLSYSFTYYHGIYGNLTGLYDPNRPDRVNVEIPGWNDPQSVILGQPVDDLVEWAHVASESDEFKRNLADMFFQYVLDRGPDPQEQESFTEIWKALPEDDYSVNRMLHRLIDTDAFGAP